MYNLTNMIVEVKYMQEALPGFIVSPAALWPAPQPIEVNLERDQIFEGFLGGVLGPEYDEELSDIYTRKEIYDRFCHFCKADLLFVEEQSGLFPANGYDANLLEYMRTFVVPSYREEGKPAPVKVYTDLGEDSTGIVLMNGAFNGVPHPGWIEAMLLVKRKYPDKKLVVGIGTNFEIENVKLKVPVGDTKWRASLLANTGLIDGIFTIQDHVFNLAGVYKYPEGRNWFGGSVNKTEENYYYWWGKVLGRLSERPPAVVVVNGREELDRKSAFINLGETEIFDLSLQERLFDTFHSDNVHVWGGYTAEYVMECWKKLRSEYL